MRIAVLAVVSALVLGGLFLLLRPDSPSAESEEVSFDIEIQDDRMTPEEITVREGDRVTMSFSSNRRGELHVHGYDLEREFGPGETAELSFEADDTGRFPIEDHDTEEELGVLVVEPR